MENIILKRIREHALTDKIAVNSDGEDTLYKELDEISNNIANQLKEVLNGASQVPIIIFQKRGKKFVELILAVLKCNCYYIPLEETVPIERVRYIVRDMNATLILSDIYAEQYIEKCPVMNIVPQKYISNTMEIENLVDGDLVYVMYTSGTTGNPKGVKIKYENLENLVISFYDILYHEFSQEINVGVLASFSFDSSVKQIYCALFYGHRLCISDSTVKNFGRKIHSFHKKNNITVCDLTPTHLKLMTLQASDIVSNTPYLIIGGEKLRWEVLNQYIKFVGYTPTFINVYGPTECCVDVTYNYITENNLRANQYGDVPIGLPLRNTSVKLIDSNGCIIKGESISGEICIYGRQVGAGYVNISSESFIEDFNVSAYRTGDIGYYDSTYNIIITGRTDKQVKINGNRVELEEISCVIEEYLKSKCVVIVSKCKKKDMIIAYIVSDIVSKDEQIKIKQYLRKKLPSYMIPNYFVFGNSIPLTNNGKINETYIVKLAIAESVNDNI